MFGGLNKVVAQAVGRMGLPSGIGGIISRALGQPIDQRQAFASILLATVAHVNQKPNFNLELEINDLWIHLTALKSAQSSSSVMSSAISGLGGSVGGMAQGVLKNMTLNENILKALSNVLESSNKAKMNIINNIR
jgi:hypothetical protein